MISIVCTQHHSTDVTCNRTWSCAWKFDGRLLATCGENRVVNIWLVEPESGKFSLYSKIRGDNIRTIREIAWSPEGCWLATASFDSSCLVYKWIDSSFDEQHRLDGHENEVKSVAFSPSGQYLATCSRDKTVFIWQFDEDDDVEVDAVMQNHSGDVKFVRWHPQEDVLVSGGYDSSITIYRHDGQDWIMHQMFKEAHEDTVWSVAFNPEGDYMVSVGGDSKFKVWKCIRGSTPGDTRWMCVAGITIPRSKWPLYTVDWDSQQDYFLIGGGDQWIWIYELDRQSDTVTEIGSHRFDTEINRITCNPRYSNLFALAMDDGRVVTCRIENLKLTTTESDP